MPIPLSTAHMLRFWEKWPQWCGDIERAICTKIFASLRKTGIYWKLQNLFSLHFPASFPPFCITEPDFMHHAPSILINSFCTSLPFHALHPSKKASLRGSGCLFHACIFHFSSFSMHKAAFLFQICMISCKFSIPTIHREIFSSNLNKYNSTIFKFTPCFFCLFVLC